MNDRILSEKVKSAFSPCIPSHELTERLMKADKPKKAHRLSALKIAAAAFAACMMVGMGTYAVSWFSFDEVFGNYVKVDDKELGDSLMGMVTDFKYKVSDDDYAIRIMGATGNSHNLMLKAEIYRTDGEPVKKYFRNVSEDEKVGISCPSAQHNVKLTMGGSGGSSSIEFNEAGNMQLYVNYNYDSNISGKKFEACGSDFYSYDLFWEFTQKNNVFYQETGKEKYFADVNTLERKDISDEDIIGLRLDWKFSFRFKPSDMSDIKKICKDVPDEISFNNSHTFIQWDESGKGKDVEKMTNKITGKLISIEFTAVGGRIEYEYTDDFDSKGYIAEKYPDLNVTVMNKTFLSDDMYLIREDGSRIMVYESGGSGSSSGNTMTCNVELEYREPTGKTNAQGDIYEQIYTDISDVTGFYFDGVTYKLSE